MCLYYIWIETERLTTVNSQPEIDNTKYMWNEFDPNDERLPNVICPKHRIQIRSITNENKENSIDYKKMKLALISSRQWDSANCNCDICNIVRTNLTPKKKTKKSRTSVSTNKVSKYTAAKS